MKRAKWPARPSWFVLLLLLGTPVLLAAPPGYTVGEQAATASTQAAAVDSSVALEQALSQATTLLTSYDYNTTFETPTSTLPIAKLADSDNPTINDPFVPETPVITEKPLNLPEPASFSLALCGLGLSVVFQLFRRRQRRAGGIVVALNPFNS